MMTAGLTEEVVESLVDTLLAEELGVSAPELALALLTVRLGVMPVVPSEELVGVSAPELRIMKGLGVAMAGVAVPPEEFGVPVAVTTVMLGEGVAALEAEPEASVLVCARHGGGVGNDRARDIMVGSRRDSCGLTDDTKRWDTGRGPIAFRHYCTRGGHHGGARGRGRASWAEPDASVFSFMHGTVPGLEIVARGTKRKK